MAASENMSGPYPRHAVNLLFRKSEESSLYFLRSWQWGVLLICVTSSAVLLLFNAVLFFSIFHGMCIFFYLCMFGYQTYIIIKGLESEIETKVSDEEIAWLRDEDLPPYTILVPLYRETEVVPQLVEAMNSLDYPKRKLDVKLLVEEDDSETLNALIGLPSHFKVSIVPPTGVRTKPKACNYGLTQAEGEYLVIYDAEDIPEPNQLKKVIVAFQKLGPRINCIQAKLDYYNAEQNLLTRLFTAEYAYWFDILLPGLWATNAPLPLGGTSNHFKISALKEFDGWDPYNVTEDCDLGICLSRKGNQTAVIDSTTWEEANSALKNWIRQRSRWTKGYIQTWIVHMAHPLRLLRVWGLRKFFSFQMVVGGTWFTRLINPYFWLMTIVYLLTRWQFIESLFPTMVYYPAMFCLVFVNFFYIYYHLLGCIKKEYYKLTPYVLLVPIYWLLMSIAGWHALLQVIRRPHFWEKTFHGLHLIGKTEKNLSQVQSLLHLSDRRDKGDLPWNQKEKLKGRN